MKQTTLETYRQRLLRTFVYIQAHLDDELDLEKLSEVAGFSPYHFHRIFKAFTGETLMEHIRRLRMERAAVMLRYDGQSITDVAFDAGYESLESFSRAFRTRFGYPPSEYREKTVFPILDNSGSAIHYGPVAMELNWNPKSHGGEDMNVEIREMPPTTVAFVRHVGPYEKCEQAWIKLCDWAGPNNLMGPESRFIGICYDDPTVTESDKIRYDACLNIPPETASEGEVGIQTIPEGTYAIYRHVGPYSGLMEAYARLYRDWLPESGYRPAHRPCYEEYLNTPDITPPEELVTLIHMAVE